MLNGVVTFRFADPDFSFTFTVNNYPENKSSILEVFENAKFVEYKL